MSVGSSVMMWYTTCVEHKTWNTIFLHALNKVCCHSIPILYFVRALLTNFPYGFLIAASICLCNHRSHNEKVFPQYAFFHELSSNVSLEHVYHKICIDRMVYPEPCRYFIVLQERLDNHLCMPYTFLWNNKDFYFGLIKEKITVG